MGKPICIVLMLSSLLHISMAIPHEDHVPDCQCQVNRIPPIHLHFYVQDYTGGPNTTTYTVAQSSITATYPTRFGEIQVLDDKLTDQPNYYSREVGRVQGALISADFNTYALSMYLNFVFTSGKYKGSSLVLLGRNQLELDVREIPVVGGTGKFRSARGYAFTSSYYQDNVGNYGIREYNVFLTDYMNTGIQSKATYDHMDDE